MSIEKQRKRRLCEGISLVEVIVALLILAISVAGLCRLVVVGRKGTDMGRSHYTAINIAKNRLERVKTFEYAQLALFNESDTVVNTSGVADSLGDYRRTTTVSDVKSNLREVVVTVEIRDRSSRTFDGEEEEVRTYVADIAGAS